MRLVVWALLALVAADPPPPTPPTPPTPTPPTPPTPPATETPPPPPPVNAVPPGSEVLLRATDALAKQQWAEAIRISAPAIATYPDLAAAFRAILDVATDQLGREVGPDTVVARPKREKSKLAWGFEVGLPTGLRFEYDMNRRVVDSIGLRLGANAVIYGGGFTPTVDPTLFVDWRVADRWHLETSTGMIVYYGWSYPQLGAAVQYDPKGPLQVNLGARVAVPYMLFVPDVSVGFVW
jgi:hypothetical protein